MWSYLHTAIEAYPDVTNVQVGVIAQAPGLAPEEVERQITQPLERELNGTPGLVSLRSESYFGLAMVNLVFNDDAVSFNARAEVSQRLPQADLPPGVTPEMAPDYTPLGKIFYYRLTSDRHTLAQLRTEQEWRVVRVLKQVQGVADVVSIGGFVKEFHVEVDPEKLYSLGLSLDDVSEALAKSNRNVGGGLMRRGEQSLIVRGIGLLDIKTIFRETAVRRKIKLRLITQLIKRNEMDTKYERLPMQHLTENILGVDIHKVVLPVAAGRNLAVLVEAAVRDTVLKLRGINTLQEFMMRQRQAMDETRVDRSSHNIQGEI